MSGVFKLHISDADRLLKAMQEFEGNTEEIINDVLHNEVGNLAQAEIYRLMPVSGKHWKGKKAAAKSSKSLKNVNGDLSVTITTQKTYQYLYFPDDGTNTRRHVGNQQFFRRGGDKVQDEIIDRCINKLINNFEKGE